MTDKRLLLTIALAGALAAGSFGIAFAQQDDQAPGQPAGQTAGQTAGSDWQRAEPEGNRATDALNLLENRGDGQFSDFSPSGKNFTATVTKNGATQEVLIDPDTQQIKPISRQG